MLSSVSISIEAHRLARNDLKDILRTHETKLSSIDPSLITDAAKALVKLDQFYITTAVVNLNKRLPSTVLSLIK